MKVKEMSSILCINIYYSIKTKKDHPKLKGDPNKVRFHFEEVKHQIVVKRFFSDNSMTLFMK